MTTRRDFEADSKDNSAVHLVIEPRGCDECPKRSKCKYRADKAEHKCALARGKR